MEHLIVRLLLTNTVNNSHWVSYTFVEKPSSFQFLCISEEICGVDIFFFITEFFCQRKKIKRLNSKTIRFDKKKWKNKVVLHYLINQRIFFLINFWRHQDLQKNISPKSLILQKEEISHLFLENATRMLNYLKKPSSFQFLCISEEICGVDIFNKHWNARLLLTILPKTADLYVLRSQKTTCFQVIRHSSCIFKKKMRNFFFL